MAPRKVSKWPEAHRGDSAPCPLLVEWYWEGGRGEAQYSLNQSMVDDEGVKGQEAWWKVDVLDLWGESRETVVKNDKVTERTQEQEWSWERR